MDKPYIEEGDFFFSIAVRRDGNVYEQTCLIPADQCPDGGGPPAAALVRVVERALSVLARAGDKK